MNNSDNSLPLRRCEDCQLNLGTRPGDTLRAAFACPMFGKPRTGVESRCSAFVAKDGRELVDAAVVALDSVNVSSHQQEEPHMPEDNTTTTESQSPPDIIAEIDAANDNSRFALDALKQLIEDHPNDKHMPVLQLISDRLEESWDKIEDLCLGEAK